jgi:tetratricopeptide (TPR) repeat protein
VEQTQYDFGLSAQADRMILSRCFTESDGRLECLSCHDPHVSIYREDRPADYFRQKCLACHQVEECSGPEHDGDCVACHMRRAEPDDQRFAEFTDHWIRRDAIAVQPDRRESFEIEAIYPERYLVLPPGEQAYYRGRAYFLLANDAPSNRRQEMWGKAEEAFREALRQGFDEADAWFFLAKTWLALGQGPRAVEALREAVARAPDHHDATFALGQALAAMGRGDESEKQFRHMLQNDPRDVMALAEMGRLAWSRKRYEDALAAYRDAVKREPLNATLHLDLGMVLASMGRFDEAAEAGVAATRLDPASVGNWEFYTNVMRAAGRPDAEREGQRQVERLRSGR